MHLNETTIDQALVSSLLTHVKDHPDTRVVFALFDAPRLAVQYLNTLGGLQYRLIEFHDRGESSLGYYPDTEVETLTNYINDYLKRAYARMKDFRERFNHQPVTPNIAAVISISVQQLTPNTQPSEPVEIPGTEDAVVITLPDPPAL